MILLIDNYDSFVYNLARYFNELGCQTLVARNDAATVAEVEQWRPRAIVISPGPCTPREAGISLDLVRHLGPKLPILGVCLGHQAIGAALGGRVIRAAEPVHGWTSEIWHTATGLFQGLPNPFRATRYHSLVVEEQSLPAALEILARTPEGIPMALGHMAWKVWGVQFHPESILTECGHQLLANFLRLAGVDCNAPPPAELPRPSEPTVPFGPHGAPVTW